MESKRSIMHNFCFIEHTAYDVFMNCTFDISKFQVVCANHVCLGTCLIVFYEVVGTMI
jgi:hypothetical protein